MDLVGRGIEDQQSCMACVAVPAPRSHAGLRFEGGSGRAWLLCDAVDEDSGSDERENYTKRASLSMSNEKELGIETRHGVVLLRTGWHPLELGREQQLPKIATRRCRKARMSCEADSKTNLSRGRSLYPKRRKNPVKADGAEIATGYDD